ncbi:MAG: outer membrane lipoprotein carrier protein LolA [Bacteroidia bacterium]|nr:outer membrane lipoprotein carrier protein LolA [Bacteroidia bacterium]
MNRTPLLLSVLLFTSAVFSAFAPQDQAPQILQESKAKLQSIADLSSTFRYEISNPGMRAVAKQGEIRYKKGKYAIRMEDQEIFCDLQNLWVFLKQDNEVNVMRYDPNESMNMDNIFRIYETGSKPRYDGEAVVHGVACHKIYLALTDPGMEYNQAYLWVNKTTKLPEKITLINRKQTSTTYEFTSLRTNVGLSDTEFRFDQSKYPAVRVYDER